MRQKIMTGVALLMLWAGASESKTITPEFDGEVYIGEEGRPAFRAKGPQYITGKYEGILANCASALCDEPRLIDGLVETTYETFLRKGCYCYTKPIDPPVVPLPAGLWFILTSMLTLVGVKHGSFWCNNRDT